MWLLWTLLSNIAVLASEFLFRKWKAHSFVQDAWLLLPLALLAAFTLKQAFGGSPRYMMAWALFFGFNAVGRVFSNVVLLHEPLPWTTILGLVVVWIGALLIRL